jgi:hypothetical protein
MRYPLVDGQGNFGSVDGDPPAAMRYTEAADAARRRAARRHRQGDGRLRAELRRLRAGADGPAGRVPQPAGQRRGRHRRRHGDEHPAAQPRRGRRRHHRLIDEPEPDHRDDDLMEHVPGPTSRPAASSTAAGIIRRRTAPGRGSRRHARAREVEEVAGQGRARADRRHRDPLPGQQGALLERSPSWSATSASRASPTSATSPTATACASSSSSSATRSRRSSSTSSTA